MYIELIVFLILQTKNFIWDLYLCFMGDHNDIKTHIKPWNPETVFSKKSIKTLTIKHVFNHFNTFYITLP